MRIDGKVAVVTGASRGIGEAVSLRLAAAGAHLLLVGRDREALERVSAQCQNDGAPSAEVLVADLGTYEGLDAVVMATVRHWDGFDILVNNAGYGMLAPIAEVQDEDFDRMVAVNLRAPFMLTQAAVKVMRRRGAGQVVQIASGLAYRGLAGWSLYCATKFGLRGFTEAVREEVARENIKVGIIAPGFTETAFFDDWPKEVAFEGALHPEDTAHAVMAMIMQGPRSDIREITVRSARAP